MPEWASGHPKPCPRGRVRHAGRQGRTEGTSPPQKSAPVAGHRGLGLKSDDADDSHRCRGQIEREREGARRKSSSQTWEDFQNQALGEACHCYLTSDKPTGESITSRENCRSLSHHHRRNRRHRSSHNHHHLQTRHEEVHQSCLLQKSLLQMNFLHEEATDEAIEASTWTSSNENENESHGDRSVGSTWTLSEIWTLTVDAFGDLCCDFGSLTWKVIALNVPVTVILSGCIDYSIVDRFSRELHKITENEILWRERRFRCRQQQSPLTRAFRCPWWRGG